MLLACSQAMRMTEEQIKDLPEKSQDATRMIRTGAQCEDMRVACREFHDWMRSKGMPVNDAIAELADEAEQKEKEEDDKYKLAAQAAKLEPEMLKACSTALSLTEEQVNQLGEQEREAIMALRLAPQFEDVRKAVYEAGKGGEMKVPVTPKKEDKEAAAKAKKAEEAFMKEVEAAKAKQEAVEEKKENERKAKELKEQKEKVAEKPAEPEVVEEEEEEILEMGSDGTFDFDAKKKKQAEEQARAKASGKDQRTAGDLKDYFRSWEKFDVDEEEEKVETAPSTKSKKKARKVATPAPTPAPGVVDDGDKIMLDPTKVKAIAEKMGIEGGAEMLRVVTQALCFSDRQLAGLANEAHMKVQAIRTGPEFAKHRAAAAMLGVDDAKIKSVRSTRNGGSTSGSSSSQTRKAEPSTTTTTTASAPGSSSTASKGGEKNRDAVAAFKKQMDSGKGGGSLDAVAAAAVAAFEQQSTGGTKDSTAAPPAASTNPVQTAGVPEGKENSPPKAAKNSPPKAAMQATKAASSPVAVGAGGSSGSCVPAHTVTASGESIKIVVQLPAIDSMKGVDIDVVGEKSLVVLEAPHYDRLAVDLSSYGAAIDSGNVRAKFSKKKKALTITLAL